MNKLIKICALSLSLGVLGGTITSCNWTQTTPVDYSEAVSTPDLVKIEGDDIVVLEETTQLSVISKEEVVGYWTTTDPSIATVDSSDPENPAVVWGEIINYEWGWEDIETYPTVKELGYSTPSTWGITKNIDALVSTTTYLGVDYGFDSTNRDLCYDLNDQFASITGLVDSTSIGATNTPALIRLMFTDSPYAASYCVVAEEDKDCKLTVGLYYRDNRIVDITSSGNGHHVALSNFGNVDNLEIKAYLESLAK